MTFKYMMEIGRAVEAGKTIQYRHSNVGCWMDWERPESDIAWCLRNPVNIRIKPEPKTRLMRADELPMPCVIEFPTGERYQVMCANPRNNTIQFGSACDQIETLHAMGVKYSGTGKSDDFHGFLVEDTK